MELVVHGTTRCLLAKNRVPKLARIFLADLFTKPRGVDSGKQQFLGIRSLNTMATVVGGSQGQMQVPTAGIISKCFIYVFIITRMTENTLTLTILVLHHPLLVCLLMKLVSLFSAVWCSGMIFVLCSCYI